MAVGASLGTAVLRLVADSTALIAGMGRAHKAALMKARAIGLGMTKFITLPLAAVAIGSGKMAADFEGSMSKITGLVGISREQVGQWSKDILRLAPEVAQSPRDLADAMFFITSAGLRGQIAIDALTASAKASSAGLGDVSVVADAVTSAMNAYGHENLNASKATDILVASVREGKMESTELAGAIGQAIPLASNMGISFDQVGAAMAGMSKTGTSAGTAAIQLRSIMVSFVKPTKQSEQAMKQLGFSADGLRESIREKGLFSTLMDLKGAVEENDMQMSDIFPNVRALNGVLDLTGESAEDNAKIFANLTDTTGDANKAFDEASRTARFKFAAAMAGLEASAISLGAILLPVFNRIIDAVRVAVTAFSRLPAPVQLGIVAFLGLLAAAGPMIALFTFMISPIGLVVLALVGLAVGLKMAWDHSETFQKIVKQVFSWLQANVPPIIEAVAAAVVAAFHWMQATFGPVAQFFVDQGQRIADFTRKHWADIKLTVNTVVNFIKQIVTITWPLIRQIIVTAWNLIRNVTKTVWDAIKIIIETVIGIIENVIKIAMGIITGDWGLAWEGMKGLVSTVLTGVVALVRTILTGLVTTALTLAKDIGKSIWEGIKTAIGLLGALGGALLGALGGAIGAAAGGAFNMAAGIGKAIVNGVLSGVGSLGGALKGAVQGAVSSALSSISPFSPVEHGGEMFIGEPIVAGALKGIEGLESSLSGALERSIGRAVGNVPDAQVNVAGGPGRGGDGSVFDKLAETVNFFDKEDSDVIIADLGNRLALRTGALA